jgi:hypothetical protein
VYGDAVGAGPDDGACRVRDARYADVALVSQQRYFVQIDAQFCHFLILESLRDYIIVMIYSKEIRL